MTEELKSEENVRFYWQPRLGATPDDALSSLALVSQRLGHLHVFHWKMTDSGECATLLLKEGRGEWSRYLEAAAAAPADSFKRFALLEFVRDGSTASFAEDAAALRELLGAADNG